MKNIMIALAALLAMAACKSVEYVTVPEYHSKDSVAVRHERDSVFIHDSVTVNQYAKGDTVFSEKTKTRTVYRWRDRIDSVLVERHDSTPVVVEKPVVEYKYRVHWYDSLCRRFTLVVLGSVAVSLLAWIVRKRLKG